MEINFRKVTTGFGPEYRTDSPHIATLFNLREVKAWAREQGATGLTITERTAQRYHVKRFELSDGKWQQFAPAIRS